MSPELYPSPPPDVQNLNTSQFADQWFSDPQYCSIPQVPATDWLGPSVPRFPSTSICPVSMQHT